MKGYFILESAKIADTARKKPEKKTAYWDVAIGIVIIILLRLFVFEFTQIIGESMMPTLLNKEMVFVNKIVYKFSKPKRGDIIIVKIDGQKEYLVKRVVGLEGETVEVRDGDVYIDGDPKTDIYVPDIQINDDFPETIVPEDAVFAFGDNRNHSMDSREYGPFEDDHIVGRAEFVLWPFKEIKSLHWK